MAEPLDPNELDRRRRERDAKEAREAAAQAERDAVEAQENTRRGVIVKHLEMSGDSYPLEELAFNLGFDVESVRRALEQAVNAGTVTESHGRYRAAQRPAP